MDIIYILFFSSSLVVTCITVSLKISHKANKNAAGSHKLDTLLRGAAWAHLWVCAQMKHVTIDSCSHSCCSYTPTHTRTQSHSHTDTHTLIYIRTQAAKRGTLWGLKSSCTLHHPGLLLENPQAASQAAAVAAHSELRVYYTEGDDCKPTLCLQTQCKTSSFTSDHSPFNTSLMIFTMTCQKALKRIKRL